MNDQQLFYATKCTKYDPLLVLAKIMWLQLKCWFTRRTMLTMSNANVFK